ncbi:MAG: hypothetical protein K2X86_06890 [Cytophagaceae bacterium]|nr:hypothetical protein [Cytophagaceae bacterium]
MCFRRIFFIAGLFLFTDSFSQSDSLYIPKLTIKASLKPLNIFIPVNTADLGAERRLSEKYTLGLYLGTHYGIKKVTDGNIIKGAYVNAEFKRYITNIKNKSFYIGLNYLYDNIITHPIVEFNVDSIYNKQFTLYNNLNALHFKIGVQSMGLKIKYPIDAGVGFGIGVRNITGSNITQGETKYLEDGRASELELEKAGRKIIPTVTFSLRIGIVAIR